MTLRLFFIFLIFLVNTGFVQAQKKKDVAYLKRQILSDVSVEKKLSAYILLCDRLIDTDMKLSLDYALEADRLLRTTKVSHQQRLEVWRVLANSLARNGQMEKSLALYKRNLRYRDSLHIDDGLGLAYRNAGTISSFLGNNADALYYTNLALTTKDAAKDSSLLASLHLNLGCFYYILSDNETSISHIMKSMKIAKIIQDSAMIADNSIQLANLMVRAQAHEEAIAYYRNALQIHTALGKNKAMTMGYHNLSIQFRTLHQYDSALFYVKKAQKLWIQIGDFATLVSGLNTESTIYYELGNLKKAMEIALQALEYSKQTEEVNRIYQTLNSLSLYTFELGKLPEALKWGEKAYAKAKESNSQPNLLAATTQLANIHKAIGNWKQGSFFFELALAHKDTVEAERNTQAMLRREALYSFEQKKTEIAELKSLNKLQILEANYNRERSKSALWLRNVVIGASFILLVFTFFLFRFRQQRRAAQFKQQLSILEMKAIQAQMNPHFMYNALGSIQGLINSNDKHAANLYLSKFAMLLRKILEFSERHKVLLSEELETLKLYIELEQLRFSFDYEFKIAPTIDPYALEIPSLLFQPFIENAIHHGLRKKSDKGHLFINLREEQKMLVCVVEDDGVGRAAASLTQPESLYKGKSYGTQLSQERLNVMNNKGRSGTIRIEDFSLSINDRTGTRVTICIPIEY